MSQFARADAATKGNVLGNIAGHAVTFAAAPEMIFARGGAATVAARSTVIDLSVDAARYQLRAPTLQGFESVGGTVSVGTRGGVETSGLRFAGSR